MAKKKRTRAEINEEKKEKFSKELQKAEKLIDQEEEVKKLKEESLLKKICVGAKKYLTGDYKEGCKMIYHALHVRPYRRKDEPVTKYVLAKLHLLKETGTSVVEPTQGTLFATP